MHIFLDNFHQGGKYSAQIASHQVDLRREENLTDQKSLFISSLQTDYLNLDSSSGCGKNIERANLVHTRCTFCGGANHFSEKCFKMIGKEKEKSCASGDSDNRRTERIPRKCFRCGSGDHLIEKCPNPPKENKRQQTQVCFNERNNLSSQKECDNRKNKNDQKIYVSLACMSDNDKCPSRNFRDS